MNNKNTMKLQNTLLCSNNISQLCHIILVLEPMQQSYLSDNRLLSLLTYCSLMHIILRKSVKQLYT